MQWNAADYAQNASAQYAWAQGMLAGLALTGHEDILDVGCGDGRITAEIAAGQKGRVMGVDYSAEMVELARQQHRAQRNLSFQQMDAAALRFESEFDRVFSNATLHWVKDHRAVLSGIMRALRPGGRALLSMGGKGNAAGLLPVVDEVIHAAQWRDYFIGFAFPYVFYGVEEYRNWLPEAGFVTDRLELVHKDMVHDSVDGLKGWIRTTWFPFTQRVPVAQRAAFIDELVGRYIEQYPVDHAGRTHVNMIRLEVEASKQA